MLDRETWHDGWVIVAAGPREAERRVLEWVEAHRAREVEDLWPPVRVVVPSRSLARHLNAVLARRVGALAGVLVQTHRALAREVVERSGDTAPPAGSMVQEILVRRLAGEEPALAGALGGLEDGYAPVAASVRDLVDAGLDGQTLAAVVRAAAESAGPHQRERCLAVIRVAGRWLELAEEHGLPGRSGLLERAAELVWHGGDELLPARGILAHGFAEATGLVSRLLEGLVRRRGGEVILDLPPDPARPGERDAGGAFVQRLAGRLYEGRRLADAPWTAPGEGPPELEAFTAPGPDAELREVAGRIRRLLDLGVAAETVGVVLRSIDAPTAAAVRRQFARMGVPFSGEGVTVPAGEPARRLDALLELLGRRAEAGVGAWLAAVGRVPGVPDLRLLELALRSAGVARLGDVPRLEPGRWSQGGGLRVPVVERIEEGDEGPRRVGLRFPQEQLQAARGAAADLLGLLEARPAEAPVAAHLEWVLRVLGWLGWDQQEAIEEAVKELAESFPRGLEVSWADLEPVLSRALRDTSAEALGGAGGGVQVLTAMEARSRTFEHLFLAGLNRGSFPRRAHEDPVLPEAVRRGIAEVLPEMPLAERAAMEERYLFAQLVASSPRVTLSWQTVNAEGRARNPSAFIERLRLEGRLQGEPVAAPDVVGKRPEEAPRPALEHATAAGLAGWREGLVEAARVLADGRAGHLGPLLEELDPPRPRSDLGGFLGTTGVGPPGELWATRLEAYSTCPWKQFLERELGLSPPPEALLAGTGLGGPLVGSVVHRVLEAVVRRAGAPAGRGTPLAAVASAEPVRVPWPGREELEEMVRDAAREVSLGQGVPVLAPALARAARRYLERARELEWAEEAREVLGAEVEGTSTLELPGGETVEIRFRADRVDRGEEVLVLTDYKTGKSGAKPRTLLRKGERLQAAVYACCDAGDAEGRYVYLAPDSKRGDDREDRSAAAELVRVVDILLAAWRAGLAVPRWEAPGGEGPACRYCDLQEACLKGDSTFRARLSRAVEAAEARPDDPLGPLWRLAESSTKGGGKGRRS